MNVGEIFVKLGFDGKEFSKGVQATQRSLSVLSLKIAASIYAIDRFVERSTNAATGFSNIARGAGIAASKLRIEGIAASLGNAGINAKDASQQLAAFGQNLFKLQKGIGDATGFNFLQNYGRGISWYGKTAEQVIEEIGQSIQGLDEQTQTMVLQQFGFGAEMLDYFKATRAERDKMAKSFIITPEQLEQMKEADKAINQFKISVGFLSDSIVAQLAPAINDISNAFNRMAQGEGIQTLNTLFKSIATSIAIINAAGTSLFDASKIAGATFSSGNQADDVNAEIRAGNKSMWQRTMAKIRGYWGDSPESAPAPQGNVNPNKPGFNNPGNIRGADGQFRSFNTYEEGMAALRADISAKISGRSRAMASNYGAGYTPTISNLVRTYAPPNENNTDRYVDFVSNKTGIAPNQPLTMGDLEGIVKSIVQMEGNKNVSFNNVYHIQGLDGMSVAEPINSSQREQMQRSHALADFNNSAR